MAAGKRRYLEDEICFFLQNLTEGVKQLRAATQMYAAVIERLILTETRSSPRRVKKPHNTPAKMLPRK